MTTFRRHVLLGGFLGFGLMVIAPFVALDIFAEERGIPLAGWIFLLVLWLTASLLFGWFRWLLRGRARTGGEETLRQRWVRPLLAAAIALTALLPGLLAASRVGVIVHGDGFRVIRVTGRLVSGTTREPVRDARVLVVSSYDLDHPWDPESAWTELEAIDAERARFARPGEEDDVWQWAGIYRNAGGRSEADGSIDLLVSLWYWFTRVGLHETKRTQEPADGVAALWVARPGRDAALVPIKDAQWRAAEGRTPTSIWGTYDLGTVVVPEPEVR